MKRLQFITMLALGCFFAACSVTQGKEARKRPYEKAEAMEGIKTVEDAADDGYPFRIHMSPDATKEKPNRLLVWLHGSGGSGNKYVEPLAPKFISKGFALMVFPQKSWGSWNSDKLIKTITAAGKVKGIDASKPFALCYSLGGQTAIRIWNRDPSYFGGMILNAAYTINRKAHKEGKILLQDPPTKPGIKTCPIYALIGEADAGLEVWRQAEVKYKEVGIPLVVRTIPRAGHTFLINMDVNNIASWLETGGDGAASGSELLSQAEGLVNALKKALTLERKLLIVTGNGDVGLAKYKKLIERQGVAGCRLVCVYVDTKSSDTKLLLALGKNLKFSANSRYVLVDPNEAKLLYSGSIATGDDELIKAIAEYKPDASELTMLEKAQVQARKEGKSIMLNFTGSDWCGYCKKLKAEVLDTDAFADWAAKNLIVITLDFPRKKIPADVRAFNESLKKKFRVGGFPYVAILNASGEEIGKISGFGGASKWWDSITKIVNKPKPSDVGGTVSFPDDPNAKKEEGICKPGDPSCDPDAKKEEGICKPGDPSCDPDAKKAK